MMKVDTKKCIGCGACISLCPETFEFEGGKAHVKSEEDCDDALEACPVGAISKA